MLASISQISTCTGISIRLTASGVRMSALSVSRNGRYLELGKRLKDKSTLQAVLSEIPAGSLIALNISGQGILHKEVPAEKINDAGLFNQLMPGANPADFYTQHFVSGKRAFISMVRKEKADGFIGLLTGKGFPVIMLSLGAYPADQVIDQINNYGEELVFDGHQVMFKENKEWDRYQFREDLRNPYPIKLGIEQIDEQLLLPYAAAFQAILSESIEGTEAGAASVQAEMLRIRQNGKLKKKGAIFLAAAFLLLLSNTLVFMHYNSENGRLQDELNLHSTQSSDIRLLAGKTAKAEELITEIGYRKGPSKAAMVDQLSAILPAEIILHTIDLNPVAGKRVNGRSPTAFTDHSMIVSGNCPSILPVNEWLARLRSLKWVTKADLHDYGLGDEDNKGAFTILITF